MEAMTLGKTTAAFGAAILMVFGSTACATKKHVRQVVAPVEARVNTVEGKTQQHASAIGELENNVSRADEKAVEAGKRADAANQSADKANQAAVEARSRADNAYTFAEQTRSRLEQQLQNINNYQLMTTEKVLFPVNRATLNKDAQAQLDQAVSQIQNNPNYILEIQGFTDPSGSREANLDLSRRRAEAVVRYLTMNHNVPLRRISVLGVGEESPDAKEIRGREARKQARRVEVKVYAHTGGQDAGQGSSTTTSQAIPNSNNQQ